MANIQECPICETQITVDKVNGFITCPDEDCEERLEVANGKLYLINDSDDEDEYDEDDDEDFEDDDEDVEEDDD